MVQGIPELPQAVKPIQWYRQTNVANAQPVDTIGLSTTISLEDLFNAGEDYERLIDDALETLREDVIKAWLEGRGQLEETENPTIARMKAMMTDAVQAKVGGQE